MFKLFILCLMTCCSAFVPLKETSVSPCDNVDQAEVIAKKPRESLYRFNNDMYLASASELFDSNFFTKFLLLMNTNVGTYTPTSFTIENIYLKFNTSEYILNDNGVLSTSGDVIVTKIRLTTATSGTTQGNFQYYRYALSFRNDSDTEWFGYTVEWFIPLNYTNYQVSDSNFVFSNFSNSGIRNFMFIFDRTSANNETIFNLLTNTRASETYNEGYDDGYNEGYGYGYNDGQSYGYQTGYQTGYDEASNLDQTALTIFTGIIDVGLLPVNVFLKMFNYEIFGINVAGFISSLLTIAIVVIIIRVVTGKGSKND